MHHRLSLTLTKSLGVITVSSLQHNPRNSFYKSDVYDTIANGLDVAGEINGEEATGNGQVLTGNTGNASTDGLAVRYTGLALPGEPDPADIPDSLDPPMQMSETALGNLSGVSAGNVTLAQNSLVFQIGSNPSQTTSLALRNMRTDKLGTGVESERLQFFV